MRTTNWFYSDSPIPRCLRRGSLFLAKRPAPKTTIALKQADEDSITVTFDPHSDGILYTRCQMDDGPWQWTKANPLTIIHLPNGPHVLKVTSIDDQLNMDAVPATAQFEIKVDTNRQIAGFIAQLSDPDYDKRKIAIGALDQQPAAALPALRKARETATDDQRWWIDAAIQACEAAIIQR